MEKDIHDRRPVKTRDAQWAVSAAAFLRHKGCTPNGISLFSIVCAAISALCFLWAWHLDNSLLQRGALLVAAVGIQGRLICNLLDGMVAVEGGMRSPAGAVFNELPDRLSDTLLFLGAGYGLTQVAYGVELAWAAAFFAIFTAYVRLLGGTCGLAQRFTGPMAKQHRMALLTGAAVLAAVVPQWGEPILLSTLAIIAAGSALTALLRTRDVLARLRQGEAG